MIKIINIPAEKIYTNDIKKGERIRLRNGWEADMADNLKGNIRMAKVYGLYTEIGSVYSHDIVHVQRNGVWHLVTHTQKQLDLMAKLNAMGW